jgi:hypothetical protein
MSRTDFSVVSWPTLAGRLDRTATVSRWAEQEPDLAGLSHAQALDDVLRDRHDPQRRDALIGALLRLGAADGGGEDDAVLTVLHALAGGARAIAVSLRDLATDIDALVIGQLWLQARTFPWRRRTHAYAANLLLDTRLALVKELLPYRGRGAVSEIFLCHFMYDAAFDEVPDFERAYCDPHDRDEPSLGDVLTWAHGTGVLQPEQVDLLVDLWQAATEADDGSARSGARVNTAAELAVLAQRYHRAPRTLRRRRDHALRQLRAAQHDYLHSVA